MQDEIAIRNALESSETLATVIHAIILRQYGEAAYDYDPTTIYLELRDDFQAEIHSQTLDRWSAMQVVMVNDAFFNKMDAFLGISNTLAEGLPFFDMFNEVTTEEAAWAVTEVSLNRELLPFSYGVRKYIKLILDNDGYSEGNYPAALEEALTLAHPRAIDIRKELAVSGTENRDNTERFIDEQLKILVYQFNQIPSLKAVDNILLNRGMDEFVSTIIHR